MLVPADYDDAGPVRPADAAASWSGSNSATAARSTTTNIPTAFRPRWKSCIAARGQLSSGLIMYPEGHARNPSGNLRRLLDHKFRVLAGLGVVDVDGTFPAFYRIAAEVGGRDGWALRLSDRRSGLAAGRRRAADGRGTAADGRCLACVAGARIWLRDWPA